MFYNCVVYFKRNNSIKLIEKVLISNRVSTQVYFHPLDQLPCQHPPAFNKVVSFRKRRKVNVRIDHNQLVEFYVINGHHISFKNRELLDEADYRQILLDNQLLETSHALYEQHEQCEQCNRFLIRRKYKSKPHLTDIEKYQMCILIGKSLKA